MPDLYQVTCPCGEAVDVQLFEAGTSKSCPACGESVLVPNITKLKASTGDKYPLLSPLEKIEKLFAEREPPFDGQCQSCRKNVADWQVSLQLEYLVEREIIGDEGIRLTLTGLKGKVAKSVRHLQTTEFPLLLCEDCFGQFQQARAKHKTRQIAISAFGWSLLAAFVALAVFENYLLVAVVGIGCSIGVLAVQFYLRQSTPVDRFLIPWLENIRWAMEAINAEMECRLHVGEPVRFYKAGWNARYTEG